MNDPISPYLKKEFLDDFFGECDEHLESIRNTLVGLEQSISQPGPESSLIEELFRRFHSFKSISAFAGLAAAESIAHAAEEFLRQITQAAAPLTRLAWETLMAAVQQLEQLVIAFRNDSPAPPSVEILNQLQTLLLSPAPAEPLPALVKLSPIDPPHASSGHPDPLPRPLWRCLFSPTLDLDARGLDLVHARQRLAAAGQIVRSTPLVQGPGSIAFEFIVRLDDPSPNRDSWAREGITLQPFEPIEAAPSARAASQALPLAPEAHPNEPLNPFVAPSHVVRVDLNQLDELMRNTAELVSHGSRFDEELHLASRRPAAADLRPFHDISASLRRSVRRLRAGLLKIRLVPISEIFDRMAFVVKDLNRDTRKQVRLTISGAGAELDKYLIERLKDPLLHLVRNAVSHGVETPEERVAAGKPPEAALHLSASLRGDAVLIRVEDDGRGIDPAAVVERAHSLGLHASLPLSPPALLDLLCAPGFSTRPQADRAAGRGIGLAVVKKTIRELGGTLSLESQPGIRAAFLLRLPLTLGLCPALIVSASGQTCALPQYFLSEVLPFSPSGVQIVNGSEVCFYRSALLPVVRLSSLFQLPPSAREQCCLVVVQSDRGSAGLLVDRVLGQREVLIHPLLDPLLQVPGISGAADLGDGKPVLVLDGFFFTQGPVRPPASGPEPSAPAPAQIHPVPCLAP